MKMKKGLAVAIIVLLVGISFNQSVIAKNLTSSPDEKEYYEVIVTLSGNINKTHTLMLSKETIEQIQIIFDDTREKLSTVETQTEDIPIMKGAVNRLNKLGIFPGE